MFIVKNVFDLGAASLKKLKIWKLSCDQFGVAKAVSIAIFASKSSEFD